MPIAKLSRLQKDILRRLLAWYEQLRAHPVRGSPVAVWGVRLTDFRRRDRKDASSRAAFSRALARLERRGLVLRINGTNGLPDGHPRRGSVRRSLDEPAPDRADHLLLTAEGEEAAKRLT
jgi:hypothetical protein